MSDAGHKFKQYDYKGSVNLVLELEKRPSRRGEAKSQLESLSGHMDNQRMGDRVRKSNIPDLKEKVVAFEKKKEERALQDYMANSRKRKEKRLHLDELENLDVYRPHTKETQQVYEVLLNFITEQLGDQPTDIIVAAAHEVLTALKDDSSNPEKVRSNVESLLKTFSDEKYATLVNIGRKITDFGAIVEQVEENPEEDIVMSLNLDVQEDGEEHMEFEEVVDISDEEEEDAVEAEETAQTGLRATGDIEIKESEDDGELDALRIDAHWLLREISNLFPSEDANIVQKKAKDILAEMEHDNIPALENFLVSTLGTQKRVFDFIKVLLMNREKIWFVSVYRQAHDQEREAICQKYSSLYDSLKQEMEEGRTSSKKKKIKSGINDVPMTSVEDAAEGDSMMLDDSSKSMSEKREFVDLDEFAFNEGSHFMASTRSSVPEGSTRVQMKEYEEVFIPFTKPEMKNVSGIKVVEVSRDMPSWTRPAFSGITRLNLVQSKLYPAAFQSNENVLLCAPTSAGKTNVAMLTVLKAISDHRDEETGNIDLDSFKIIYIAPMKSLVQEMVGHFGKRLEPFGIRVDELSGDQNLSRAQLLETQIIVTTPEKWDVITRKSSERTIDNVVKLIIIDEVHLLHDERGPVLEALIARTLRRNESSDNLIRLVGLSATLPNFEDVASVLRVPSKSGLFVFDNSFRPCPLQQTFVGITVRKALKRLEAMNSICYDKVMKMKNPAAGVASGESIDDLIDNNANVLVFVHARKETAITAKYLRDKAKENDKDSILFPAHMRGTNSLSAHKEFLEVEAESVTNRDLQALLPSGIGIHHAGMTKEDRAKVESLFKKNLLRILVSTATLAWGVNLPAHTVIIKGTQVYNPEKGDWVELSSMDIMQMLGRAGRPQFDKEGEGVVITSSKHLHYYLSLMNHQLPIESQLISRLPDCLNAEIVLGTIQNLADAIGWLKYTYLGVRMKKNPSLYRIPEKYRSSQVGLNAWLADLVHSAAMILDKHHLIQYDVRSGDFGVNDLGRVASHFYISHHSMASYSEILKPAMSDIEIFRCFALSNEFRYIVVRDEEKLEILKVLQMVPVPVKESADDPLAKINILLQAYISNLKLTGLAMVSDSVYIAQNAARIFRALYSIALGRGWGSLAERLLETCKKVERRMWEAHSPLRQVKGILKTELLKRIEKKDIAWQHLVELDESAIGELIRLPKMAERVRRAIHHIPRIDLAAAVQPLTPFAMKCDLVATPNFFFNEKYHGNSLMFWIYFMDVDGEKLLHYETLRINARTSSHQFSISCVLPITDPLQPAYVIRMHSDSWIYPPTVLPLSFRRLIIPAAFPPPTELLDLHLVPVESLNNAKFSGVYPFRSFNLIQTNCFSALYHTQDNILVCAPVGSGKTVCAEIAMMRLWQSRGGVAGAGNVVYLGPTRAVCERVEKRWKALFGPLGVEIVNLIGDTVRDSKLISLSTPSIVISEPGPLDSLVRRWNSRKRVQNLDLLIADDLHLMSSGALSGHVVEMILSRLLFMKYGSNLQNVPLRIIALSSPVGSSSHLMTWLRVPENNGFCFPQSAKAVSQNVEVRPFVESSYSLRMLSMSRPMFDCVLDSGKEDIENVEDNAPYSAMVVVPTVVQAHATCNDILHYVSRSSDNPAMFVTPATIEKIESALKPIQKSIGSYQTTLLSNGIGYVSDSQPQIVRDTISRMFADRILSILIAPFDQIWNLGICSSKCVIVIGTSSYSHVERRAIEYPLASVLECIGRAGRQGIDSRGFVHLFVQSTLQEFYQKFINERFPLESCLSGELHDHLAADIVSGIVKSKADAIDWLTWTFLYLRITRNPNYYSLSGVSNEHVSDFLSQLIEDTCADLESSSLVRIENDMDLIPLNVGMISSYYHLSWMTMELFVGSCRDSPNLRVKGLIEILANANEFEDLSVSSPEEKALREMARHCRLKLPEPDYASVPTKVNLLLQAHFSRSKISFESKKSLNAVLLMIPNLIYALVDVISSCGYLKPALAAMELCQMCVMGMWVSDTHLLQVPHLSPDTCKSLIAKGISNIFDLMEEEEARESVLKVAPLEKKDIFEFCNGYPAIDMEFMMGCKVDELDKVLIAERGDVIKVKVQLKRDVEEDEEIPEVPTVFAPRYPGKKVERWWVVIGDTENNTLLAVKRVSLKVSVDVNMEFIAPEESGEYRLKVLVISDSFMGVDIEEEAVLRVFGGAQAEAEAAEGGVVDMETDHS